MKEEFVTYEQSLALKQLGFDEPCFGWYEHNGNFYYCYQEGLVPPSPSKKLIKGCCLAPLKQQVFMWFRENNMLLSLIFQDENMFFWYEIESGIYQECTSKGFDSYEEAETECINKLIEIVKNK